MCLIFLTFCQDHIYSAGHSNIFFNYDDELHFIVVINTECEGICYRIYAWQKFQIMPERR